MKKLLLILLCLPLFYSCGADKKDQACRYDFEIVQMIDKEYYEIIKANSTISNDIFMSGLLLEGVVINVVFRFDTKTGEIKYFDLYNKEIKKEKILNYVPVINSSF